MLDFSHVGHEAFLYNFLPSTIPPSPSPSPLAAAHPLATQDTAKRNDRNRILSKEKAAGQLRNASDGADVGRAVVICTRVSRLASNLYMF